MSETDKNNVIDYNSQYMNHKRCFKCQRETEGIEAYQSISKNGKTRVCKTCNKCRSSVQNSLVKYRKPTIKEKYDILKKCICLMSQDNINDILEKLEEYEKKIILGILN